MHFEGICGLKTELNYPFNNIILLKDVGYNTQIYVIFDEDLHSLQFQLDCFMIFLRKEILEYRNFICESWY